MWANPELVKLFERKHRLLRKQRSGVRNDTVKIERLKSSLEDKFKTNQFGQNVDSRRKWNNLNRILKGTSSNDIEGVFNVEVFTKQTREQLHVHLTHSSPILVPRTAKTMCLIPQGMPIQPHFI